MFTRAKATTQVVAAHRRKQIKDHAMSTAASASSSAVQLDSIEEGDDAGQIAAAVKISKMLKSECVEECKKLQLDVTGSRAELRERIAAHCHIDLGLAKRTSQQKQPTGKHAAHWTANAAHVAPVPFGDSTYNVESLKKLLAGFPDTMPTPEDCWEFFFTPEMQELGSKCTNIYPKFINSCLVRPPWTRADLP